MDPARFLPHATEASRTSRVHGPEHWHRVANIGAELAVETLGADSLVVWLFAGIHDSRRLSDRYDPHHGRRAAALAKELRGSLFEATDGQMALLEHALEFHADGYVSEEPSIGACWDADRLDLPRCGITPDPELLSTEAAKARVLLASLAEPDDLGEPVFVRFGSPPPDGRSYNKRAMTNLPGLSVFKAHEIPEGFRVHIPQDVARAKQLRQAEILLTSMLQMRPIFVAEGAVVARGPDAEPVLGEFVLTELPSSVPISLPEWLAPTGAAEFTTAWQLWRETFEPSGASTHRHIRDAPERLRDQGREVLAATVLLMKDQPLEGSLIRREIERATRPRQLFRNPWRW